MAPCGGSARDPWSQHIVFYLVSVSACKLIFGFGGVGVVEMYRGYRRTNSVDGMQNLKAVALDTIAQN